MINLSNLSIPGLTQECVGKDYFSIECLNKNFCPQIHSWMIQTGIVLVAVYILHEWVIDFFIDILFSGSKEQKLFIKYWIKDRLTDVLAIFILLVVLMNR